MPVLRFPFDSQVCDLVYENGNQINKKTETCSKNTEQLEAPMTDCYGYMFH